MAMVFKSKKPISEILQKDLAKPGPGEYLPQTVYNKKNLFYDNIFTKTSRDNFYSRNNNPGPGYYFKNENSQDKKNKIKSDKDNKEEIIEENKNKNKEEKLGFNIKEIRFKIIKDKIKQPGPGHYFPNINKFYKTNFIEKIKYNSKPRKINRKKTNSNLIPSIPSKDQKYGFNILEDGNIEPKKPPNFYQTFTGVKGDTVGPGSYEIEKSNDLYKSSPKWTITKDIKNVNSLITTNFSENSKFLDTSNVISSVTVNKFYIDDNMNVKELSPYNISSNSFLSLSNSRNINSLDKNESNYKKISYDFKRMPFKYTNRDTNEKNKKDNNKDMKRLTFKINTNPGPGFYIDRFKNSSFNYKSIPETHQFFGSNERRFKYYNNNINSIEKEIISDENNEIKIRKYKGKIIPFSSSEERFKVNHNLLDKNLNPSPVEYYPKIIKRNKSFSNFTKFGTCETKFVEKKDFKWKKEIPGPGTYNPEKIKNHINTKKMIKTKDYNNKIDIYKNQLNYQADTIEYKNYKKSIITKFNSSSFYRTNPSLKKSLSCKNITPPPGFYYVDKIYEAKQSIAPFNSSSNKKFSFLSSYSNYNGPCQYRRDSYFDWNKKSFNISYL